MNLRVYLSISMEQIQNAFSVIVMHKVTPVYNNQKKHVEIPSVISTLDGCERKIK